MGTELQNAAVSLGTTVKKISGNLIGKLLWLNRTIQSVEGSKGWREISKTPSVEFAK